MRFKHNGTENSGLWNILFGGEELNAVEKGERKFYASSRGAPEGKAKNWASDENISKDDFRFICPNYEASESLYEF